MDEPEAARTKQLIWELVAPLFDRLDQLQHEVGELRARVQACEDAAKRASGPPAMLPPGPSDGSKR